MTAARLISVCLAAALLAGGVAAVALVGSPWLFDEVQRAAPALADPLAALPRSVVDLLADPALDAPSPFTRIARVKPEAFCKSLVNLGLKNPVLQFGEPPLLGWTCITDLLKPIDGDETRVSSLFVAVRGLESDRIDTLRMKLNLLDPATTPVVKAIARDVLTEIWRSFGWDLPAPVLAALDGLREGRVFDRGVSYDLRKEFGPTLRLNFIIIFPRTLGVGGEGRFVTDARRSPVAH